MKCKFPVQFFLVLAAAFFIYSCGNPYEHMEPGKWQTCRRIIKYISTNDTAAVYNILDRDINNDKENIDYHIAIIHDYINNYGLPPEYTWRIEYDTSSPIFKLTFIDIPINCGKENQTAILKLGFDKTGIHLPDTKVAYFDFEMGKPANEATKKATSP